MKYEKMRKAGIQSGSHFDPAVVETFLSIDRKTWLATAERYQDSEAYPSTLI
jgi:response regulator RpfG family c-di-GMP phosphodiesterase